MSGNAEAMWELHHGDALEYMQSLRPASVDAVITDPPFFAPATHYQSRVEWGRAWSDMSVLTQWWERYAQEAARVTKDHGHCLVFCNADSYAAFYPAMFKHWPKLVNLVWDKDRPGLGRVWRHQHELVIAARKANAYEPADGRLRGDVLRHKATLTRDRSHPVEKPEAMLQELIVAAVPKNGVVLDPFAGSGTTGSAALKVGRRFMGAELDADYHKVATQRLTAAIDQPPLFGGPE